MEDKLAALIARLPGVVVTHHYRGSGQYAGYFVHCEVEGTFALHRLCQLAARANAPLQVYEHSDTKLRYTLIVNDCSREILMCES